VDVLISEDTYELTKQVLEARPVREITVKGREKAVKSYEVLGLKGEPPIEATEIASAAIA
jgi:class 3 adenylate cyclase